MSYVVKAYEPGKINLAPKTIEEEILQNVAMIISTPKFSVPLDRDFGISQRFVDMPIQTARAVLISEVLDAVERSEPRVKVKSVTFELGNIPGKLNPIVEVNIIEGTG